jgi:hypothetical protein
MRCRAGNIASARHYADDDRSRAFPIRSIPEILMSRPSPDAAAILALPHRHHPRLAAAVEALAECEEASLAFSERVIAAAMLDAGITELDVEMCQPDAAAFVPFGPSSASPNSAHDEMVAHHLHTILARPR